MTHFLCSLLWNNQEILLKQQSKVEIAQTIISLVLEMHVEYSIVMFPKR